VYLNYGIHYLVNAVTEAEGSPAAVLIRALDPTEGIDLMCRRRGLPAGSSQAGLCRGPGNLTVALAITQARNRADLTSGTLRIEDRGIRPPNVSWSPRIGIRVGTDKLWRCAWDGHAAVSASSRRARSA
jgi:DNA-3-methyladenine glycosylase